MYLKFLRFTILLPYLVRHSMFCVSLAISNIDSTFVCPGIFSIIVIVDQQDANFLVLFVYSQSPILISISSMTPAGSNIGEQYQKL